MFSGNQKARNFSGQPTNLQVVHLLSDQVWSWAFAMEVNPPETSTSRRPLAERQPRATPRPTPTKPSNEVSSSSPRMPHHESLRADGNLSIRRKAGQNGNSIENKRVSTVAEEAATDSKRSSQASASTTYSNKGKRKTHVGPWHLGKTLGKGATGRVRLGEARGNPANGCNQDRVKEVRGDGSERKHDTNGQRQLFRTTNHAIWY